jgi:hypothetical protein
MTDRLSNAVRVLADLLLYADLWACHPGCRSRFRQLGPTHGTALNLPVQTGSDGSGMSPYAELHADGQFGEAGYNLLFSLARQELRRFPGLQVATADDDAVWDVVGDFLVERGHGVTAMLLASASDDNSLGALLRTSLRHWLIDEARKTDLGALRRRLERLISEDERFEVVPGGQAGAGRWRLAGTSGLPTGPPLADLCGAAWSVRDVRIPPWSSEERRAPAADGESLGRIMLAVLTEAGGSLEPATVAAVFADRLPHALDPAEEPLDDDEAGGLLAAGSEAEDPAEALIGQEADRDAVRLARDAFAYMSAEERRLLPHLDGTIGDQMKATGRGRSQTYLRVAAVRERLRALLGEEQDRGRVLGELLRLCRTPVDGVPDGHADMPSIGDRR